MIGQEKLLQQFDNFTVDTLPRSIMLIGEDGCGKHLLCNRIAERLNLQLTDLTENIESEVISELYNTGVFRLLYIDMGRIHIKDQNIILKLLEEPPVGVYIVLLCNSTLNILATVRNRCRQFHFEAYTKEQLLQAVDRDDIPEIDTMLQIVHTPGRLQKLLNYNFNNISTYTQKIVDKLEQAPFYNVLNITNQVAFKNEQNKFDPEIFAWMILHYAQERYKENYAIRYSIICEATQQLLRDIVTSKITHFDIKCLYDNYLLNLKMRLDEVTT